MAKMQRLSSFVAVGSVGLLLGGLIVSTFGEGGSAVGSLSDAEIANEVVQAGELVTWELEPGEVCMRWGRRFQVCDTVSEERPPTIGLGPDDPPPTPLGLPLGPIAPPNQNQSTVPVRPTD